MSKFRIFAAGLMSLTLTACKPAEPAPDLLKSQHEALNKAKAVEGQLQRQAEEQRKTVEEQK